MSSVFEIPIRVYIEDTDAGGIVYYVNYLKFVERSRTELLRSFGYGKTAILDDGLLLVVHSLESQYLAPARLDDELMVSTEVKKVARAYVLFHQQVKRGDTILCKVDVKIACVTPGMKPSPLPEHIRQAIQAHCHI